MRTTILTTFAILLAACGGSKEEAKAPETAPEPPQHREGPKMQSTQELGSIDPGEVQRVWNGLQDKFLACKKEGTSRVEYLNGDVRFFLRVGPDGRVKWAYLEDSTLGDRDTEKCMIDVVSQAQWPKPDGGDAEVRNSIGFDPEGRPPTAWASDKISTVLEKNEKDLMKCKKGGKTPIHVTLYVEPHKKNEGKVQAAGASVPAKDAGEQIDCIVDEVKSWKMPSPGSWGAKVDFRI